VRVGNQRKGPAPDAILIAGCLISRKRMSAKKKAGKAIEVAREPELR
jgi:hypothetical protein